MMQWKFAKELVTCQLIHWLNSGFSSPPLSTAVKSCGTVVERVERVERLVKRWHFLEISLASQRVRP
jgi:hypothetical protein